MMPEQPISPIGPVNLPSQLELRLASYFSLLEGAVDISPAEHYRLEGYLQACLDLKLLSDDALSELISEQARRIGLESLQLAEASSDGWRLPWKRPSAEVTG